MRIYPPIFDDPLFSDLSQKIYSYERENKVRISI